MSRDVRGARVDDEAIVGLAVNMLVIDTVVTAACSVVTMVGSISDSKLLSVIKSTTLEEWLAVDITSNDVINDGGLDNIGMNVNGVIGTIVEYIDDIKVLNLIVVLDNSITVSVGCIGSAVKIFVTDGRADNVLLVACVTLGSIEVDNATILLEADGNVISDIVGNPVLSSDILISKLDRVESTKELVGSKINDDIISNDVIVTLV